jgi:hypothetical protein
MVANFIIFIFYLYFTQRHNSYRSYNGEIRSAFILARFILIAVEIKFNALWTHETAPKWALRSADFIASKDRMIVSNELEGMWKEAVVD